MAAFKCDTHEDRIAVVMMTNLENGDTATLCEECFPLWAAGIVQALGGEITTAADVAAANATLDEPSDEDDAKDEPAATGNGTVTEPDTGPHSADPADEDEDTAGFTDETVTAAIGVADVPIPFVPTSA